jgi:hypothetical protein
MKIHWSEKFFQATNRRLSTLSGNTKDWFCISFRRLSARAKTARIFAKKFFESLSKAEFLSIQIGFGNLDRQNRLQHEHQFLQKKRSVLFGDLIPAEDEENFIESNSDNPKKL